MCLRNAATPAGKVVREQRNLCLCLEFVCGSRKRRGQVNLSKMKMKMLTADILALSLLCVSYTSGFMHTPAGLTQTRMLQTRMLQTRMQCEGRDKGVVDKISTALASAAIMSSLLLPFAAHAGNNYPPIDKKLPNRCEVN